MRPQRQRLALGLALWLGLTLLLAACAEQGKTSREVLQSQAETARGRHVFRSETFGDEALWTDTLRLNEVIQSAVDPATALAVGLKVDATRLPPGFLETADLSSPATTVELLRRDAVVGLRADVTDEGALAQVGVTCALCHSTVDDSVAPGIGKRLDGWPNRDLNPGLILSLSTFFDDKPVLRAQLQSWGPGYYDPYWNLDGISDPVLIPPAYGLKDVPLETYTGEGPVSYWNAYVAITQMGGLGTFKSEELGIDIEHVPDLVTPKLPVLRAYQFSLDAPLPPEGSFDPIAAERGGVLFAGKAECASCHSGDAFTDAAETLHAAEETGMNPRYASRGTTGLYRTTPLRGAWQHAPYFHDGSAASLADVVRHYNDFLELRLTEDEQRDLVEYLKSL